MSQSDGYELEKYIEEKYKDIGAKRTKASGSKYDDSDIEMDDFLLSCKYLNSENVNVKKEWMEEVILQAQKRGKKGVVIRRTSDMKTYAIMEEKLFRMLLKVLYKIKEDV